MPQTAEWRAADPAQLRHVADTILGRWRALAAMSAPNEATTERTLIEPTFQSRGWDFLSQQSADRSRRDIADALLFRTSAAHAKAGFAADLGHTGPPFAWDEEDRLHLRARLDALFFLLYGLDRDAARYILSTFPIVREEEQARYQGRFRSRDLILGYMAAFAAGDPTTRVAG